MGRKKKNPSAPDPAAEVDTPPAEVAPPLVFEAHGRPVPKGSTTAFIVGKKGGPQRAVVAQGGSKTRRAALAEWGDNVRTAAMRAIAGGTEAAIDVEVARFVGTALEVEIEFRLARPKNHFGTGKNDGKLKADAPPFPVGMPDIDKLSRAVLDALTGSVFDDDSRVARLVATKVYGAVGREGARIRVAALGVTHLRAVPQTASQVGAVRMTVAGAPAPSGQIKIFEGGKLVASAPIAGGEVDTAKLADDVNRSRRLRDKIDPAFNANRALLASTHHHFENVDGVLRCVRCNCAGEACLATCDPGPVVVELTRDDAELLGMVDAEGEDDFG